jgi:hypothetical protein
MISQEVHNAAGPDALASSLLETLDEEYDSLLRMHRQFEQQLAGIRGQDHSLIESAALIANDEVNILGRLKQKRDRQIRLLGRVLRLEGGTVSMQDIATSIQLSESTAATGEGILAMRNKIRDQAERTRERCHDLEFAIEYSVHLGRELLQAIQGVDVCGGGRHYTSKGGMVDSTPGTRSFVNRIG